MPGPAWPRPRGGSGAWHLGAGPDPLFFPPLLAVRSAEAWGSRAAARPWRWGRAERRQRSSVARRSDKADYSADSPARESPRWDLIFKPLFFLKRFKNCIVLRFNLFLLLIPVLIVPTVWGGCSFTPSNHFGFWKSAEKRGSKSSRGKSRKRETGQRERAGERAERRTGAK